MLTALIILCAKYLIYVEILAFIVFVVSVRRGARARLAWMSFIALPLAYIVGKIASYTWYDTRPFVESGLVPLIEHVADNGFPSDHMLLGATLASLVTVRSPRWGLLFWAMAIAVGASRVAAQIHHPIDIIASAIIGIVSALIAFYIIVLRKIRKAR